jgi:hypothetical protein
MNGKKIPRINPGDFALVNENWTRNNKIGHEKMTVVQDYIIL